MTESAKWAASVKRKCRTVAEEKNDDDPDTDTDTDTDTDDDEKLDLLLATLT